MIQDKWSVRDDLRTIGGASVSERYLRGVPPFDGDHSLTLAALIHQLTAD